MFLSKLIFSPRSRKARRDLHSPYDLHRTLAHAFDTPDGINYRQHHGVLFRIEPMNYPGSQAVVLVQSHTAPDWHELPEEYVEFAEIKAVRHHLVKGQVLSFRLLGNPTRKVKRSGKSQGKRIALVDYSSDGSLTPAREWLARKGNLLGFEVGFCVSNAFWLGNPSSDSTYKQNLPIYGVRFEGLLQVTDTSKLVVALKNGIGPSKAFGFGLLSLAKA